MSIDDTMAHSGRSHGLMICFSFILSPVNYIHNQELSGWTIVERLGTNDATSLSIVHCEQIPRTYKAIVQDETMLPSRKTQQTRKIVLQVVSSEKCEKRTLL